MKIDKNRLDKYSITATVLTSRIILSFMSAHTLILSEGAMRLRLFRGHIAPSFVSTDMHFREGSVPEKAVMPHGIVREDG